MEAAELARNAGAPAECFRCDVSDFTAAKAAVAAVLERFGGADILINNAGITRDGLLLMMKESDYDIVMDTNLKGAFNMIRHITPIMIKKREGRIINVTSIAGLTGNAGQSNYSAAKAGMIGLTKSVARELAGRGVTCNAVAPGFIATDMTACLSDAIKQAALETIPLKRMGEPEEVAAAVSFLAGPGAKYITGEVLRVDGGLAM
ncbi:MAG: 3-oxoacyl-ACP reductase FabG, partial [Synergistaceae bacterium]|nr:3-oxoacyl-ACP reductase FabG [Synergistaceae bacterium]